ncbi:alpha/beta hydrolase family protein [Sediminitomix flava]|uniref:Serine aminopeptidase S33 family n=1 Tax=Sediminitomix flava TaxID=379075 RepID=A0A315Z761_SEDFL|nr:alpha/beta hydrolase [Sediminitomix flava]PWJ39984.1 serine aminopeptidase S33 family [Sediminitomix flava]
MKLKLNLYISFIFFSFFYSNTVFAQKVDTGNLQGEWIGQVSTEPYPDLLSLRVMDSTVLAKMFYNNVDLIPLIDFKTQNDSLSFSINSLDWQGEFSGYRENENTIRGKVRAGGEDFPFHLRKMAAVGLEDMADMVGYFSFDANHVVELNPLMMGTLAAPIEILDYKTGKRRMAIPVEENVFEAGPSMYNYYPSSLQIVSHRDSAGALMSIDLIDLESKKTYTGGKRLQGLERVEEIQVESEGSPLYGTITYPNIKEKAPLVIFVPGAGVQARGNTFDEFVRILPYYGYATLVYDKRGCGMSEGDRNSSFDTLASDILSFVDQLVQNDSIDAERIGLVGFDQAGYVMPIALNKSDKLKFAVSVSSPTVGMKAHEKFALKHRMEGDGFDEEQVNAAISYLDQFFNYWEGTVSMDELEKDAKKIEDRAFASYLTMPSNKAYMAWWEKFYNFDPAEELKKVKQPYLALYGADDVLLSAKENAHLAKKYLKKNSDKVKVEVYPKTNHMMFLEANRGDVQLSEVTGYTPEVFYQIIDWVDFYLGKDKP